jgi:hypothetical protein
MLWPSPGHILCPVVIQTHKGKANVGTVLFLMPDLGEVESLLKFKLPHKKWLRYYEGLLADVDGEVV